MTNQSEMVEKALKRHDRSTESGRFFPTDVWLYEKARSEPACEAQQASALLEIQ
jgi:hypothetical protein